MWDQHPNQDIEHPWYHRNLLCASSQSPYPLSKGNHYSDFYHHRLILPILGLYIKVITCYAIFCIWHLSQNILSRRFIHVTTCCDSLSLGLPRSLPFYGLHNLFTHSTVDRYLFPLWDYYKNAAMNILYMSFGAHFIQFCWVYA